MELETAKAILTEVFHARLGEVEESGPEEPQDMLCMNVSGKSIS